MFGLFKLRYRQSEGEILSDIRPQISSLNKIAPIELGKCGQNPECLWGRLLEKEDVLMGANQGLKYGGLIKAFIASDVVGNYLFKEEAIRRAASVDFFIRLELGIEDKNFRGDDPT